MNSKSLFGVSTFSLTTSSPVYSFEEYSKSNMCSPLVTFTHWGTGARGYPDDKPLSQDLRALTLSVTQTGT